MSLPKKIEPCPIIEAIIEVRFESLVPKSAVFGIIYNEIKDQYTSSPEALSILQLPEQVRAQDPGLKNKPHYKLIKGNIVLQIGPDVLTISMVNNYSGWEVFSKEIYEVINKLIRSKIIKKFSRLGLRYVNFFDKSMFSTNAQIFNNINIDVNFKGNPIDYKNTVLRTGLKQSGFNSNLLISNDARINDKTGSIIDIDTFIDDNKVLENFSSVKKKIIEKGHEIEKSLFYELLTEEFLKKHNVTY